MTKPLSISILFIYFLGLQISTGGVGCPSGGPQIPFFAAWTLVALCNLGEQS